MLLIATCDVDASNKSVDKHGFICLFIMLSRHLHDYTFVNGSDTNNFKTVYHESNTERNQKCNMQQTMSGHMKFNIRILVKSLTVKKTTNMC